jgi:flagellar motor protein MotB
MATQTAGWLAKETARLSVGGAMQSIPSVSTSAAHSLSNSRFLSVVEADTAKRDEFSQTSAAADHWLSESGAAASSPPHPAATPATMSRRAMKRLEREQRRWLNGVSSVATATVAAASVLPEVDAFDAGHALAESPVFVEAAVVVGPQQWQKHRNSEAQYHQIPQSLQLPSFQQQQQQQQNQQQQQQLQHHQQQQQQHQQQHQQQQQQQQHQQQHQQQQQQQQQQQHQQQQQQQQQLQQKKQHQLQQQQQYQLHDAQTPERDEAAGNLARFFKTAGHQQLQQRLWEHAPSSSVSALSLPLHSSIVAPTLVPGAPVLGVTASAAAPSASGFIRSQQSGLALSHDAQDVWSGGSGAWSGLSDIGSGSSGSKGGMMFVGDKQVESRLPAADAPWMGFGCGAGCLLCLCCIAYISGALTLSRIFRFRWIPWWCWRGWRGQ